MTSGGAVDDGFPAADRLVTNTWRRPGWSDAHLLAAKGGRSVSVVFPTRDHADVIDDALLGVESLVGTLIDDVVVVDTGSVDQTVLRARAAGARVVDTIPREPGTQAGRGESIWRALEVTDGDLVVVADPRLDTPVSALLAPLLVDAAVSLVKGFRRRPRAVGAADHGEGRLTELLIRPVLASLRPELAGVIAPLGREFAATRELLSRMSIAPGPSADIGILLDTFGAHGIEAIAQVDLGMAAETDGALTDLGPIGRQIVATLMDRSGVVDSGAPLVSFRAVDGGFAARRSHPTLRDLPPMSASNLPVS